MAPTAFNHFAGGPVVHLLRAPSRAAPLVSRQLRAVALGRAFGCRIWPERFTDPVDRLVEVRVEEDVDDRGARLGLHLRFQVFPRDRKALREEGVAGDRDGLGSVEFGGEGPRELEFQLLDAVLLPKRLE